MGVVVHIIAMRHGQSEYNILGLCNDDPERQVRLTLAGRRQAEIAGQKLRQVPLQHILCSQLPRAHETAEIVGQYHAVAIETRAELNDIRSGCDGKPVVEYFRRIAHDRLNARVNDGESLLEHKRRILNFLDWLKLNAPYRSVLLVAHEETMRVFAAQVRQLNEDAMLELNFENCETLEFEL